MNELIERLHARVGSEFDDEAHFSKAEVEEICAALEAASSPAPGEARPLVFIDAAGDAFVVDGARLLTLMAAIPKPEIGGKLLPLYASPPATSPPEPPQGVLEALKEVSEWIYNWSPNFTEDPEWPATAARVKAAIANAEHSPLPLGGWKGTHRHKKRGSEYRLIGGARLQTSTPLENDASVVVYQSKTGDLWVRDHTEFFDGRFEPLPSPSSGDA